MSNDSMSNECKKMSNKCFATLRNSFHIPQMGEIFLFYRLIFFSLWFSLFFLHTSVNHLNQWLIIIKDKNILIESIR